MKTVRSTRFLMAALFVASAVLTVSNVGALHPEQAQPEIVLGPSVAATFEGGFPFHGAGGDEILLFGVQPSHSPDRDPGIAVASRSSGNEIGSVIPPPVGWRTPLSIEVYDFDRDGLSTQGSFIILDAGVEPRLAGTMPGYIHRYSYSYSPEDGLVTTWLETHVLPLAGPPGPELPTGLLLPMGFTLLPDDGIAVTDGLIGSIWVAGSTFEDWRLAMIDPRFAPGLGVPDISGIGRAPGGGTRPYTLRLPSPFPGGPPAAPGIHSITYAAITDELVTLRTAQPGGLYVISRTDLLDTDIPPFAKAESLRAVVPPQIGLSDLTDGIVYDRFHPDTPWVYWQRATSDAIGGGSNVLRRVHLLTGQVQEVARSNTLYDWTSNLSVLPGPGSAPFSVVLSAMGQEENNPEVNVLLTEPQFVSPSLLTVVIVSHR